MTNRTDNPHVSVSALKNRQVLLSPDGRELIIQGEIHCYSAVESREAPALLRNVEAVGFESLPIELLPAPTRAGAWAFVQISQVSIGMKKLWDRGFINEIKQMLRAQYGGRDDRRDYDNPTLVNYAICSHLAQGGFTECSFEETRAGREKCGGFSEDHPMPLFASLKEVDTIEHGMEKEVRDRLIRGSMLTYAVGLFFIFAIAARFFPRLKNYKNLLAWGAVGSLLGLCIFAGLTEEETIGEGRNEMMADGAYQLMQRGYHRNMIVVGTAHVKGIAEWMAWKYEYKTVSRP